MPVDQEQSRDDTDQDQDISEDGHHANGEHFVQRIHVVSDAGDQAPDGIAVEKSDLQALQVAENLHAQVVHHPLPGHQHGVGLAVGGHEPHHQKQAEDKGELLQAGRRVGREVLCEPGKLAGGIGSGLNVIVNRYFVEQRHDYVHSRVKNQQDYCQRDPRAVGTQIGGEASE